MDTTTTDDKKKELKYIEYKSVEQLYNENPHLSQAEQAKLVLDILPTNLSRAAYRPKRKYNQKGKIRDRRVKLDTHNYRFVQGRMKHITETNKHGGHNYEKKHHHHFVGHNHGHAAVVEDSDEIAHNTKHDFSHQLFAHHTQYGETFNHANLTYDTSKLSRRKDGSYGQETLYTYN
jgi:hypothetical protein